MLFVLHASSGQWIERSSQSFISRSVDYGEEMFLDMYDTGGTTGKAQRKSTRGRFTDWLGSLS